MADGFVPMVPSSVDHTGTSATIDASGKVTFVAVNPLSLNGVFTSSYTNYMIVWNITTNVDSGSYARFRAGGTDNTSTEFYYQQITASGTGLTGTRSGPQNLGYWGNVDDTSGAVNVCHVYRPHEVSTTVMGIFGSSGWSNARIDDYTIWHNVSASYDGITIYHTGGTTYSGTVHVYGFEE